jgi:PAS domain S-box-containing protein
MLRGAGQRMLTRYAFGVVVVALAFGLKMLLEPVTGTGAPFVLFFAAVAVTSIVSGPGPGLVTMLVSLPLGAYSFVVRAGYTPLQAAFQGALFGVDALIIVFLSFLTARARRAAEGTGERLSLANDAAAIASWDLDVATQRVRWEPETGVLGLPPGEPSNVEHCLNLIHPDDRDAFRSAFERSLDPTGDATMRAECRVMRHDGATRWISWVGRTHFADRAAGRCPVRQVGAAMDVTERREREGALRDLAEELSRSERHRRDLIELAPDAVFLADLEGRFTDVNQAACRMLGYEREELIAMTIPDTVAPEDAPRLAAARASLVAPGQVSRGEWTLKRKDGTPVPVEVSASILPDGRWQAFVRDISARKRIEDERQGFVSLLESTAREREELLARERAAREEQRFLAEAGEALASSLDYERTLASVAALVVRDLADWCIVDVIEHEDQPRRLKVVCADPDRAPLAARFERLPLDRRRAHLAGPVLESKRPFLVERMTPDKLESFAQDGEHLEILRAIDPCSLMALPLLIRGKLVGVLVIVSSRSSRSYGPGELALAGALADRAALAIENGRLYQAAVHATRLRDEVLGVVVHDLRNPLASILLQAAALQRLGPDSEHRSKKAKESILRAAERMNRLIGDLLEVSLIEAEHLRVERSRVSARQLLVDATEAQRPLAASAALDLQLDLPSELPEVWGDPMRLLQVLANLVGNAIKFTPAGGHVTVGAAPRAHDVLFWVADTGRGMSSEEVSHVFERFWQAGRGAREGAGLGLTISRGIIETHGGRIWVESTPGRGSVFFFTIPQAAPAGLDLTSRPA